MAITAVFWGNDQGGKLGSVLVAFISSVALMPASVLLQLLFRRSGDPPVSPNASRVAGVDPANANADEVEMSGAKSLAPQQAHAHAQVDVGTGSSTKYIVGPDGKAISARTGAFGVHEELVKETFVHVNKPAATAAAEEKTDTIAGTGTGTGETAAAARSAATSPTAGSPAAAVAIGSSSSPVSEHRRLMSTGGSSSGASKMKRRCWFPAAGKKVAWCIAIAWGIGESLAFIRL